MDPGEALLPVAQGAVIRVVSDEYLDRPSGVGLALSTKVFGKRPRPM